jgi:DNA mismatch repair protein MutS
MKSKHPILDQYRALKAEYPDALLLMRLGDFYEVLEGDAEVLAEACDLVLTTRLFGKKLRVAMAAIPHHALDGYVKDALAAGYTIAVAEQAGPMVNGYMERRIDRVLEA